MKKTYRGSCHCGAVAFEADIDLSNGSTRCNCSFCHKNRFWMTLVDIDDVRVTKGADALTDYRQAPEGKEAFLHLTFCSRCGVRPFSRGGFLPAIGNAFYAVNVATLDLTDDERDAIPVTFVDGRRNTWAPLTEHTKNM